MQINKQEYREHKESKIEVQRSGWRHGSEQQRAGLRRVEDVHQEQVENSKDIHQEQVVNSKDVHQEQVENSKDTDGKLLTESNEVVRRWTGNCRDLYNYDDELRRRLLQEERDTRTQVVGLHRSPDKRWTLPGAAQAWARYR